MKKTPPEKIQIYIKSINVKVFKVYLSKLIFLGGTSKLN